MICVNLTLGLLNNTLIKMYRMQMPILMLENNNWSRKTEKFQKFRQNNLSLKFDLDLHNKKAKTAYISQIKNCNIMITTFP